MEERPLCFLLNKNLSPQQLQQIYCRVRGYHTDYEGENRCVIELNAFKHPPDAIDRARAYEMWTGDPENDDFTILDKLIKKPRLCYLFHKHVPEAKIEELKELYDIVEVTYYNKKRYGILCCYYEPPKEPVPFQIISAFSVADQET